MLTVNTNELSAILADYGLPGGAAGFAELQRYDYEYKGPDPREVRLILRVDTEDGRSLVLRLKNESDAPLKLIEAQSRFAQLLRSRGIETPRSYRAGEGYARQYALNGYEVVATLEDWMPGELKTVDPETAEATGALLARMHGIAEAENAHVDGEVLFDPLRRNDLFSVEDFSARGAFLRDLDEALYRDTLRQGEALLTRLRAWEDAPRYAVQGDISDCNLYRTAAGELGVFDFNRCGDNVLFFDAVMQALFEARLMDYPEDLGEDREQQILSAFLRGYDRVRPFTRQERELYPALYALISAFWLGDLRWDEGSLVKAVEAGDRERVRYWLETVHLRAQDLPELPL